jgi:hypothetical protein
MSGTIRDVTSLAERLSAAKIHYDVSITRPESILFSIAVPGERWEIEVMADGSIEIEVFRSNGEISDASKLDELFERFSD